MTANKETVYTKDAANKKLKAVREFDAPVEQVWNAWTQPDLLDQWWAPKPYKANTKSMDFREGGTWLYCMEGPDGDKQWCRADYETVVPHRSFTGLDAFCDEDGNINTGFPQMHWKVEFLPSGSGTRVEVEVGFSTEADMEKIIEMGFKEGFAAAHGNLDELLAAGVQKVQAG